MMMMMGALDFLSDFCTISIPGKKRMPMQTVEIKVKMDCDGCERRVRSVVSSMKGVKSVEVNRKQSLVTVGGYVEPNKVLKRVRSTGKKAELWPYIPYNLVTWWLTRMCLRLTTRRRPPATSRTLPKPSLAPTPPTNVQFATLFSDENPNACSIM